MICVLDASFAVALALNPDTIPPAALKLFEGASMVIAPTLFCAETANAIWKYYAFGSLNRDECFEALARIQSMVDSHADDKQLMEEALQEACNLKHSVYDLLYLILTRRKAAVLLTNDKKLKQLASKEGLRTC